MPAARTPGRIRASRDGSPTGFTTRFGAAHATREGPSCRRWYRSMAWRANEPSGVGAIRPIVVRERTRSTGPASVGCAHPTRYVGPWHASVGRAHPTSHLGPWPASVGLGRPRWWALAGVGGRCPPYDATLGLGRRRLAGVGGRCPPYEPPWALPRRWALAGVGGRCPPYEPPWALAGVGRHRPPKLTNATSLIRERCACPRRRAAHRRRPTPRD